MATTGVYNEAKAQVLRTEMDLVDDDIRVLLVDDTFVFDASHEFVADVLAGGSELFGSGYVRKVLTGKQVSDRGIFTADNPTWIGADFGTVDAAVVFKLATDDADSPVVCCVDLNPKIRTNTGSYQAQWGASGILRLL